MKKPSFQPIKAGSNPMKKPSGGIYHAAPPAKPSPGIGKGKNFHPDKKLTK